MGKKLVEKPPLINNNFTADSIVDICDREVSFHNNDIPVEQQSDWEQGFVSGLEFIKQIFIIFTDREENMEEL